MAMKLTHYVYVINTDANRLSRLRIVCFPPRVRLISDDADPNVFLAEDAVAEPV